MAGSKPILPLIYWEATFLISDIQSIYNHKGNYKMTNEDLQFKESNLPSEVITLIGQENIDKLNPFALKAVVKSLFQMYEEKGLDWLKENKEQLINNMLILDRM